MTLTLSNIDYQYQIIVSLVSNYTTKEYKIVTESTTDVRKPTLICTPASSHYCFSEAFVKNPSPNVIKSQDGKFLMTFIFLDKNE